MAMFAPLAAGAARVAAGAAASGATSGTASSLLGRVGGSLLSGLQFGGGDKEKAPERAEDAPTAGTGWRT